MVCTLMYVQSRVCMPYLLDSAFGAITKQMSVFRHFEQVHARTLKTLWYLCLPLAFTTPNIPCGS